MKKIFAKILSFVLITTSMVSMAGCENALFQFFSSTESSLADSSFIDSSLEEDSSFMDSSIEEDSSGDDEKEEGIDFSNTTVEVVAYDGSDVTVTFYHTMGATLQNELNKAIGKFNAIYPNITIKHSSKGDYSGLRDQITTEINAGTAPTMAYCFPDHVVLYNKANATVALDGYIAKQDTVTRADGTTEIMGLTEAQKADYVAGYYGEGAIYGDGLMYTLPFSKSTEVLYYNKTYFDAHNYEVPTTWDEMEALCAAIEAAEPKNTPLGYDSEANWFITMCEQYGLDYTSATGNHFLFNTAEHWAFVEEFKDWYDKGYFTTEEINGGYTSSLFTTTAADKRKTYMCIASSSGASYQCPQREQNGAYPFEVGVAMIPQVDPENPKVISQGPSVCLFKKTNPQEVAAAWLFLEYLTTNVEFQAAFSMRSGCAPVIKSVEENPVYQEFLARADGNENLQASCVAQTIAQMSAYFISPAFVGSGAARDEVSLLMQNVFLGAPANGQSLTDFVKSYFDIAIDSLTK